jgi:hypothetical protein
LPRRSLELRDQFLEVADLAHGEAAIAGALLAAKPSFAASLSRASACPTWRISPERPISPNTTVSAGTGSKLKAESSAAATARSAAGSLMRKPPATLR